VDNVSADKGLMSEGFEKLWRNRSELGTTLSGSFDEQERRQSRWHYELNAHKTWNLLTFWSYTFQPPELWKILPALGILGFFICRFKLHELKILENIASVMDMYRCFLALFLKQHNKKIIYVIYIFIVLDIMSPTDHLKYPGGMCIGYMQIL
jgi:hypothetical protein